MPAQVPVRLVPKNRAGTTLPTNLLEVTPATAKELAPAPGRAEAALGPALSLGIRAAVSPRHALDGVILASEFAKTFGCDLQQVSAPSADKGPTLRHEPRTISVPQGRTQGSTCPG